MLWMLASTIMMGFAGLFVFIYFFRKGQFEEMEDVKYELFRQEKNLGE